MTSADPTHGRPASEPHHGVETVWDARILARDGVELSANLWLPRPAAEIAGRFPAVLEMIPYGKDNWRRNADIARGTYLAQRGYDAVEWLAARRAWRESIERRLV